MPLTPAPSENGVVRVVADGFFHTRKPRRCYRLQSAANNYIELARIAPGLRWAICVLMKAVRFIMAVMLLLVFEGSATMLPAQSGGMAVPDMEAMADEAMPNGCDRCNSGDLAMTGGSCTELGTCLQAVPAPAEPIFAGGPGMLSCYVAESSSGLLSPPDSSPPKD
jgi:hypothetical protein